MTETSKNTFFLFAGEPSGDLHGSRLIQALKKQFPQGHFNGVGGPEMRREGLTPILKMEDFEVMGFTDVLFSFPKLYKQFYIVRDHILIHNPATVVLIDYADFNLRLAKSLRKKGYKGKIAHYISPSVWAWRKSRIHSMANTLDLLMTIYPFEKSHYTPTPLKVTFVGNPLQEYISKYVYANDWKATLGIPSSNPLIALFPGSRNGEILRNLQLQLQGAEWILAKSPDRVFGLSCLGHKQEEVIRQVLKSSSLKLGKQLFLVPRQYTYELMRDSQTAVAKSGTVTLELALHHRPTIVIYNLTRLNYFIAKHIMRLNLPSYCIVNILAGKEAFPELIEHGLTSENLGKQLYALDHSNFRRQECIALCQEISNQLSGQDASHQAAKALMELTS